MNLEMVWWFLFDCFISGCGDSAWIQNQEKEEGALHVAKIFHAKESRKWKRNLEIGFDEQTSGIDA